MIENLDNLSARESIMQSIRAHLEASVPLDALEGALHHDSKSLPVVAGSGEVQVVTTNLVELFKESLEAVDGRCLVVRSEGELTSAINELIARIDAKRIAISDAPEIKTHVNGEGREVSVAPSASEIFGYDVGVSCVQAAIAETGTLLLDSSRERNRLLSLVPPVHIAIVKASQIVETLGEALALMQRDEEVSPIVTLITGPSRTADIELTLAIGVHGPQELFVVVHDDGARG